MVWDVSQDDFNNRCGEGKFPLLSTIANTLLPDESAPNTDSSPDSPDSSTDSDSAEMPTTTKKSPVRTTSGANVLLSNMILVFVLGLRILVL